MRRRGVGEEKQGRQSGKKIFKISASSKLHYCLMFCIKCINPLCILYLGNVSNINDADLAFEESLDFNRNRY